MTEGKRLVGQVQPRLRGQRTHLCVACDWPVSVYGRCAPCLHAFCLSCAAAMPQCLICRAPITKLERIPAGQGSLLISPLTLQSFRSEADLAAHARTMQASLANLQATLAYGGAAAAGIVQQQQQQQQQQMLMQQQRMGWQPPPPPPPGGPQARGAYGGRQQQRGAQAYGRGPPWQGRQQ